MFNLGKRALVRAAMLAVFVAGYAMPIEAKTDKTLGKYGLSGSVRVTVGKTDKCLAKAGGAKMGQQFHAWRCRANSSHQVFVLKSMKRGWYQVRSKKGGMCLDVSGSAKKTDAPVVQWRCKSKANSNQLWAIIPGANKKSFLLKASHSGKCLHLGNAKAKVSTFVQQPCKPKDAAQNLSVWR
ncbi:MAG: ricin-type beta-trefoil lectin domain protein [Rhodospirillaceae bacterium]|mgnify:CR=1 FL=1|jgi:galactose oxidase|nr:ricin-type beta-trefoil lectin domain protein [Rhodospirillaceae bacterium]